MALSDNLIEQAKNFITPDLVQKLSGMLGESTNNTLSGLRTALPAVMAGVAEKGSSELGARDIMSMIREGGFDKLDSAMLMQQVLGGQTQGLLEKGQALLASFFGHKTNSIVDTVSSMSGVRKNSASSLLGLAAPMVMSLVGKHAATSGFSTSSLMGLLSSQKSALAAMLPAGLSSILGGITDKASFSSATQGLHSVKSKETGRKVWPALLALLLLLAGFLLWRNRTPRHEYASAPQTESRVPPPSAAPAPPPAPAPQPPTQVSADEQERARLAEFLSDPNAGSTPKTFVFRELNFETGSTRLTPDSQKIVDELAVVFKEHGNARVKLEGHTDNVGSSTVNARLSKARADAIRDELTKQGVEPTRVATAGRGESNPIATNKTPEGRLSNRRVEIVVVSR